VTRAWLPALAAAAAAGACFSEHEPNVADEGFTCERAELPPGADTAIVVIRGFAYEPAQLDVAPGTRIVWINCEPEGTPGHTTTAEDGSWDSQTLQRGDVFSTDAPAPGAHDYFCRPHPFIRGRIVVQDGALAASGRPTDRSRGGSAAASFRSGGGRRW
jgi:plastocyanin